MNMELYIPFRPPKICQRTLLISAGHSSDVLIIILVRCQRKSPTIKHFDHAVRQVFTIERLYLINTEDLRGNTNVLFGSSQMFE